MGYFAALYLIACSCLLLPNVTAIDETRYVRAGSNETLSCPITGTDIIFLARWRYCDNCNKDRVGSVSIAHEYYSYYDRFTVEYDPDNNIYNLTLLNFNGTTDVGVYFCEWYLRNGSRPSYFYTVEFADPSNVTVTYENATEGDKKIIFTCQADGNPQTNNFSWKHIAPDGQTVIRELQGDRNGNQYTLTLNNITYEDSGFYECTVSNGVQGLSAVNQSEMSGYFIIEESPTILEKDDSVYSGLGDSVTIEVSFYSVPKYISVTWYDLNGNLPNTVNATSIQTTFYGKNVIVAGYVTILKFDSVTANDFMPYRVVVVNRKGSASFVKTLKGIKTEQTSSVAGAVVGTIVLMLVLVAGIVLLLWRKGIVSFNKLPCLCKQNNEQENPYHNHTFDNQDESQSDNYQTLTLNRTPETLYDYLSNPRNTPEINSESVQVTTEKSEQLQKETSQNKDSPKTEDDDIYVNTKLN